MFIQYFAYKLWILNSLPEGHEYIEVILEALQIETKS